MNKLFFASLLFVFNINLFGIDYSEMSTQELIAIMGYVKPANKYEFLRELNSRIPSMTPKEKKEYEKNLKKMREKRK